MKTARKQLAHAICQCESHAKVAKGRDEFGDSLSAPAAEYTPQLCQAFAILIIESASVSREAREVMPVAEEVCMGLCDPHGLRLFDDRVPKAKRAPTFSLRAHAEASAQELRSRPIAE